MEKRKYRADMTEEEWNAHIRELQLAKTKRLSISKLAKEKAQRQNETPEQSKKRLERRRANKIAVARKQGILPKPPARSAQETTAARVAWAKRKRQELRLAVIALYGGKCKCCGTDAYQFLTLQHCNGDGKDEREKHSNHMQRMIERLRDGRREDCELLCFNCHFAIDHYGGCPHDDPTSHLFLAK